MVNYIFLVKGFTIEGVHPNASIFSSHLLECHSDLGSVRVIDHQVDKEGCLYRVEPSFSIINVSFKILKCVCLYLRLGVIFQDPVKGTGFAGGT